jgi:elongation factor 2 kinase
LDLAKYHELGRFSPEGSEDVYDHEAAMFHLRHAADLGILEAIIAMSQVYLGLPHDILSDITKDGNENAKVGFQYLQEAARAGDRSCTVLVAKAFDTGAGLPADMEKDWTIAADYYEKLVASGESQDDTADEGCCGGTGSASDPVYELKARLAEILTTGGNGLEANPTKAGDLFNEAAEAAAAAMKGRLANKYYMLAEEAYALVPSDEEE